MNRIIITDNLNNFAAGPIDEFHLGGYKQISKKLCVENKEEGNMGQKILKYRHLYEAFLSISISILISSVLKENLRNFIMINNSDNQSSR